MEVNFQSSLQFLNLDDVDANDAEYLRNVLYTVRSPSVELPWTDDQEPLLVHWPQHPPYDAQPVDTGGGGEMYPMHVPVSTTMPQMYPHPVVPPMPNVPYVTSLPNYHHGMPQPPYPSGPPQQMYPAQMPSSRPRGSKPSPKRGGGGGPVRDGGAPYNSTTPAGYGPPHPSYTQPMHPVPFQFTSTAPHFPTTQHATGHPLFIPSMPVYPPPPIYNYMYSHLPQGQPPEDKMYIEKVEPGPVPLAQAGQPHNVYLAPQPMEEPAALPPPPPPPVKNEHHHVHHQTHPQQQQPKQIPDPPAPEEIEPEKPATPLPPAQAPPPSPAPQPAVVPPATVPSQGTTIIHVEKPLPLKSHPPKDAIITTAPPSLPPAKRKGTAPEEPPPQQQQPQQQQQQPPPPAPTVPVPQPKPSYAGLFKTGDESGERRVKPPQNAVAISTPPTGSVAKPHYAGHADSVSHKADVDPALRSLGEKLLHYKLEHKAILLTPRGLTNPNNYCYINATLQALIACPAFYNLIKVIADVKRATHSPISDKESKTPIIDSMVQFINEFQQSPPSWFKRTEKVKARKDTIDGLDIGPAFEPTFVYKMLRKIRREDSFHEEGRQEDAEEFLSLLLNGLNDEMVELQKLVADANPTPVVNGEVTANGGDSHDDWKEVTVKGSSYTTRRAVVERTPLSDIFRGQLRSRVRRSSPEESTVSVQPFFTLQLDIESSEKVNEALEKLVEATMIDGDANSGLMHQQQTLEELPCVLILHLKCFHYRQQAVSKVMKALQFPIDLRLDPKLLSTKGKPNPKARQYKLFAVVYHDGKEATKGHYLADVYHLGHSGWIRYDDAVVKPVKEEQVLDPKPPRIPYLLYYRRADTIGAHRPA